METTYNLRDEELEAALFEFLRGDAGFFRGPYLDVRLPFRTAGKGEDIPLDVKPDFPPYQHQLKAFERLYSKRGHQPQQTLVTTGTGSGKTECFLYPVLDHCLRERKAGKTGIKAILLYPMNALASDQALRLAKMLWEDERLKGVVSAGLYVGGGGQHGVASKTNLIDKREQLRQSPPDILLTNYKMLDYLLMRPDDRALWRENGPNSLRYLVLDELHTYDGAQGSDVACLIRRLKARLDLSPGSLCCVGTSATIGDGDEESMKRLREFAGQVFDEDFLSGSIIVEDRLSVREDLGARVDIVARPEEDWLDDLTPSSHPSVESWLEAQRALWLGDDAAKDDPVTVGEKLRRHEFLHMLLGILAKVSGEYSQVQAELSKRAEWFAELSDECKKAALDSFIGLISHARRLGAPDAEGKQRELPFLSVQVQLWLREVRKMLRAISTDYQFTWKSELGGNSAGEAEKRWLPLIRCRDCGDSGWAAIQKDGDSCLSEDSDDGTIGRAWFDRSPNARYIAFGHGTGKVDNLLPPEYLCPECLGLGDEASCDCMGSEKVACMPVRIGRELTTGSQQNFKPICPECGSEDGLMFLASRGSSLLSVSISHLFQTEYNADKKLLGFTDSVQDASHRAGFFGARTYRFNFRTMLQDLLNDEGGRMPLKDCGWRLLDHAMGKAGTPKAVPVLVPHDLRDHPDYEAFLAGGGDALAPNMKSWLGERLSQEATFEFGLSVRQGRSLEKVGCSTVEVDPEAVQKAAEELSLIVTEDGFLNSLPSGLSVAEAHYFLTGLVARTRLRGGVLHPWLKSFAESRGNRYLLSKRHQPCSSIFGQSSVYPRFLLAKQPVQGNRPVFDVFGGSGQHLTWYRDWASRTLGVEWKDQGIEQLYREALAMLTRAGVFFKFSTDTHGQDVWGVDPELLSLVADVRQVVCDECNEPHRIPLSEVEMWQGQPCTKFRCNGKWGKAAKLADTFYTRIYRSGRIARVFSDEHTGLLERKDREELEERFKRGEAPDAPNLLVCTPTLEMGIDIGDLSSVLLCSVPPATSMYLQRVGRAGRKDGNAFCMTMAVTRPHDLYFHSDPNLMLKGAVDPPGCFLDSPEMLKRQLVANAMDAWARDDKEVGELPRKVTTILNHPAPDKFPERFLSYYEANQEELCEEFLERFPDEILRESNRESLRRFALSDDVREEVTKAFDEVGIERKKLSRLSDKARDEHKLVEAHPERFEDPEESKLELEAARKMFSKLLVTLGQKYPLNVMTDAGVLPNYAFPEPGVQLESVVSHVDGDTRRYESYEYMRPASVAIRELAPFNTFYAEGRRVTVDEVDLGSRNASLVESWRLCASCNHTERVSAGETPPEACPACADTSWADTGRIRKMLHFRRSRSLESRLEVTTADQGEDRQQSHYQTADLIDVRPENLNGARLIPNVPFGFELLKDLLLREVNFGPDKASDFLVAGGPVNEDGFKVCMECGRVKKPGSNEELRHAATCKARRNQEVEIDSVYLYREVRSEAIRLLLPFSQLDLGEQTASFRAALSFGLRQRFGGRADHLQVKTMKEPLGMGGHRNYLVMFDTVPGGTGYLADLWREDGVLTVLQEALDGLKSCECQSEGKDGCYRCLFAFQGQRDLEMTSSETARKLLESILDKRGEIEDADTLSDVTLDETIESELEDFFRKALMNKVGRSDRQAVIRNGEKRWEFKIGEYLWELTSQVDLGPGTGVAKSSRPDFLLKPLTIGADPKPIAVFCDGHAYHVCPNDEKSRLGDDIAKRRAIVESKGYRMWSVTWHDLTDFESGKTHLDGALLNMPSNEGAARVHEMWGLTELLGLAKLGNMSLLWLWLSRPDEGPWLRDLARIGVNWTVRQNAYAPQATLDHEADLVRAESLPELPAEEKVRPDSANLARAIGRPHVGVLARMPISAVQSREITQAKWTIRLEDSWAARKDGDFHQAWRCFLQAWNLLQFIDTSFATSTEDVQERCEFEGDFGGEGMPEMASEVAEVPTALLTRWLDEGATDEEALLLQAVADVESLDGEPGYELEGRSGRCSAESLIAWPEPKVAIVDPEYPEDQEAFIGAGWIVLDEGASATEVIEAIQKQLAQSKEND
ncbi:MAG: DEAD/DEAH box helicase [Planctomycetota bacterium]|nr:DEAD/DEAH box helicase [Planctomycetota bacterium]